MILFLKILFRGLKRFIFNANEKKFIWLVIKYSGIKRYVSKNIKINKFNIIVPDTLSFIWQYKEIFANENYKFQTDSNVPVIFDCGANIGTSCLYFSQIYPHAKIIAFEADPEIAKFLNQNLINNNIKNVEVINKAVWVNNDRVNICIEGADGASIYSDGNLVSVKAIRLKDAIERENYVDMLKIDIEGAEYDVILDCRDTLGKVKNIFIEYHSFVNDKQKLSKILGILENNNFRYFIKPVNDREIPFINRRNKNNPQMDLQLNIYGYRVK